MKLEKFIWITIFIIGFGVRFTGIFHPIDTKSWRESDVSSIARNYCRNGMDFSKPQIDWDGKGPGYTESEFPIYPYLIAVSYKIFGVWEPFSRIISFLFSLGAMFFFFRLCKYLLDIKKAIAASFFFAFSPLLMITSVSVQPESTMFFFYICSAYMFIRWIDNLSKKYYILTIVCTALALLCKLPAINIGILFLIIIIIKKGWRFLIKPKVLILGILCVLPAILWYSYSNKFYLHFGNSLGISNEYAWIGWDFFLSFNFIFGILQNEVIHIWSGVGLLIIILALITTKITKKEYTLPFYWLLAASIFYIITARTSSDNWAFYYHIFSVPSVSMLLGISVIQIYDKYFPTAKSDNSIVLINREIRKRRIIVASLVILMTAYLASNIFYLLQVKPYIIRTSEFYKYKSDLLKIIPKGSLILASGNFRNDGIYPIAYNSSYFFYWLDMKGYNICAEDQSLDNVLAFKEKGANYFVAETKYLNYKTGFEEILRKNFKIEFEGEGIILYKL